MARAKRCFLVKARATCGKLILKGRRINAIRDLPDVGCRGDGELQSMPRVLHDWNECGGRAGGRSTHSMRTPAVPLHSAEVGVASQRAPATSALDSLAPPAGWSTVRPPRSRRQTTRIPIPASKAAAQWNSAARIQHREPLCRNKNYCSHVHSGWWISFKGNLQNLMAFYR